MSFPPSSRLRLTLVSLMGAVGLLAFALGAALESPARGAERFVAVFEDAGAILDGSDVKISGVRAGTVTDLRVIDGQAHVGITVDRAFLPLHEDATFAIRPVSLLGERYVDVDPGTAAAPTMEPGAVFGASRTSRAVELDDVLNALDDPTSTSLATLVTALGGGMAGHGEDAKELLAALGPALGDTDELVSILDDQNAVLQQLLDSLTPVTEALARDRGERLDDLVDSASGLFAATAARQQALEASIQRLPGTLRAARASLEELAGLADRTTETLRDVRPVTTDLQAIATEVQAFADTAEPALAGLDPVLDHGNELVEELRPMAAALRPASDDLRDVSEDVRPIVETFIERRGEFFAFVRNWALTTNASDGVSHYFRASITAAPDNVPLPLPGHDTAGSSTASRKPADGSDDGPVEEVVDDLGGTVEGLTGLGGGSSPAGSTSGSDSESVTGLTQEQERGLVEFLLGGS